MTQPELLVLLLILSGLCLLINIGALVYARMVQRTRSEALERRPIAAILFSALQLITVVATLELVYLTVLFIARSSYSITVAHPPEIPWWVEYMATGQYFIYYGETLIAGVLLLVVSFALRSLDTNQGPFGTYGTEPDPGVFAEDRVRKQG